MAKYIALPKIRASIEALGQFHVFFGTTYLVLKKHEVPVGKTTNFVLDAENREHLRRYFRAHPNSDHFFTPFKIKKNEGRWRDPKYASTSLQAINTQGFSSALLHQKGGRDWGWSPRYLEFLSGKLPKGRKLPLWHLAIWFGRDETWPNSTTPEIILRHFMDGFQLLDEDLRTLFDTQPEVDDSQLFQGEIPAWHEVIEGFGTPPDVPPEGGASLRYLEFSGLGPPKRLSLEPASRLNLITGDNGLGKTFLLDVIWWALTQEWVDQMVVPLEPVATPPAIRFSIAGSLQSTPVTAEFDPKSYRWRVPPPSAVPGLVLYARVDGSFAVWDPAAEPVGREEGTQHRSLNFSREEVWSGHSRVEGLIRDWVRWQTRSEEFPAFETFKRVVQRTRPPDLGEFSIGSPRRVRGWPMEVPTLVHPYGTVPIIYESAGIRRILTLAYLIVWAWEEHKIQARAAGRKEERQMVILLDEAEAHLHPRWQRVFLPALIGIAQDLHEELFIQYFVSSHSPLVLASAEPVWDDYLDCLFHLEMSDRGKVVFGKVPFELRGTADAWLQSPSFDEIHPGSEAAENALLRAKQLLESPGATEAEVRVASEDLAQNLAAEDPFWLRWLLFAAQHNVNL